MLPMTRPSAERRTSHTVAGARATRIKNTPGPTGCVRRYSPAIRCLRSPRTQSITGMPLAAAKGPHPASEQAGQPHQMSVVQLLAGIVVQPPPPAPKPARTMTQREVGVQHHPVNAVVGTSQQIPVPLTEVIGHPPTVESSGTSPQPNCPEGAIPSERSLGRDVGPCATSSSFSTRHQVPASIWLANLANLAEAWRCP